MNTNDIHPTAIIGADVKLGHANVIGPYVVIWNGAKLGNNNYVGSHASIGSPAECKGIQLPTMLDSFDKQTGQFESNAGVEIGNGVRIGEQAFVAAGASGATRIENDCQVLSRAYVGHDSSVGKGSVISPHATLAGFVKVGAFANVGLGALIHQNLTVGPLAMVGMGAIVVRSIVPFGLAYGVPARVVGANRVGLSRFGADESAVRTADRWIAEPSQGAWMALPSILRELVDPDYWPAS